jgi:phosphatidylglycerol:prolipoprotein diacylglycerol transferase
MTALAFGRIGCFLNGCCYGKPTDLACGVHFPYGSYPYLSQVNPNPDRDRHEPHLTLPDDFFGYFDENGYYYSGLKPYDKLTEQQKQQVTSGPYRCLAVHPTQLYSSLNAVFLCCVLWLFWHRYQGPDKKHGKHHAQPGRTYGWTSRIFGVTWVKYKGPNKKPKKYFAKPGCTFGLMFVVYGITRFFIEFVRDDNPYEFGKITVSQNIGIGMIILGFAMMVAFDLIEPKIRIDNSAKK